MPTPTHLASFLLLALLAPLALASPLATSAVAVSWTPASPTLPNCVAPDRPRYFINCASSGFAAATPDSVFPLTCDKDSSFSYLLSVRRPASESVTIALAGSVDAEVDITAVVQDGDALGGGGAIVSVQPAAGGLGLVSVEGGAGSVVVRVDVVAKACTAEPVIIGATATASAGGKDLVVRRVMVAPRA